MLRPHRAVSLLAVLAVPALAAGCSVGKKLKTDQIETQIAQQYKSQTGDAVSKVACPDDVDVKSGATFTCALTLRNGKKGTITITQLDDKGHVRWSVGKVA
jgi:major membrane immunogen (membrane-anchored lipoprotein)